MKSIAGEGERHESSGLALSLRGEEGHVALPGGWDDGKGFHIWIYIYIYGYIYIFIYIYIWIYIYIYIDG